MDHTQGRPVGLRVKHVAQPKCVMIKKYEEIYINLAEIGLNRQHWLTGMDDPANRIVFAFRLLSKTTVVKLQS